MLPPVLQMQFLSNVYINFINFVLSNYRVCDTKDVNDK